MYSCIKHYHLIWVRTSTPLLIHDRYIVAIWLAYVTYDRVCLVLSWSIWKKKNTNFKLVIYKFCLKSIYANYLECLGYNESINEFIIYDTGLWISSPIRTSVWDMVPRRIIGTGRHFCLRLIDIIIILNRYRGTRYGRILFFTVVLFLIDDIQWARSIVVCRSFEDLIIVVLK